MLQQLIEMPDLKIAVWLAKRTVMLLAKLETPVGLPAVLIARLIDLLVEWPQMHSYSLRHNPHHSEVLE